MNKSKLIPDDRPMFMTLAFFAARHGIKEEYLSWGIRKVKTDENTFLDPIVIIKNTSIHIDVKQDLQMTKNDLSGKITIYRVNQMVAIKDRFIFVAKNHSVFLSKKDAQKLYAGKYLM